MKKPKIILTAIILIAVVASALGFKANRIALRFFYQRDGEPNCTAPTTLVYIPDYAGTYITYLTTTTISGDCPQIRLRLRL